MEIHISRKGEQFGPYTEAVARQYLEAGNLAATDLAWHAGADGWKPLGEVLGISAAPPPVPAPPPEPTPPPEPGTAPSPEPGAVAPPESGGGSADEIFITRKGKQIGPITRAKALENYNAGKLIPTDWAWHDGMDEWKPIWEVLDLGNGSTGVEGQASVQGSGGAWSIGDCLGEGWQAVKGNFGGVLLFVIVSSIVLGIGMIIPLVNLFVGGALFGGLALYYIKLVRGQNPAIGDLFAGFSIAYVPLLLVSLLIGLVMVLGMIPGIAVIMISAASFFSALQDFGSTITSSGITEAVKGLLDALKSSGIGLLAGLFLLSLVPTILMTFTVFAYPLVVDQRMSAMDAMKTSMRMVKSQFFKVFLFLIVVNVVANLGSLVFGIGVLVTIPIAMAAMASCYIKNVK